MYKIVFIDIDGTLRDSNKQISKKNIESIKKIINKEILVVICSGRPRLHTEIISKQCFASKYIITSNGGNVYDYENKKEIYNNIMDKNACIELYNIAKENNAKFMMNVSDVRVVTELTDKEEIEIKLDVPIKEFLDKNKVNQCIIADTDFYKIKSLQNRIEKVKSVEIKNRSKSLIDSSIKPQKTTYYDVANIETSKGTGIVKLCEYLHIDLKEAIAIGDDYNDISMFEKVGYSVVMENATESVKKYANEITKTNNEDGVAVFLEKLAKNKKLI